MKRPLKVGITGGIGSGKSFVCDLFRQNFGISVYNTDIEVKLDILKRESVKKQIIAEFGEDSYLSDGSWNREKFLKILFDNSDKRNFVNRIVTAELRPTIERWVDKQNGKYVLIECAVLFETGLNKFVDITVAVSAPDSLKIKRLKNRGVDEETFWKVKKIQCDDDSIVEVCDYIILNNYNQQQLISDIHFSHTTFEDYWLWKNG